MNNTALTVGSIIFMAVLIASALFYGRSDSTDAVAHEPLLQHVHGFVVDVANPDRLLIATHHGLLQLEDGKLSRIGSVQDDLMGFTPHPTDSSIFFSSGHPMRGGNLGFQKSIDGGVTWEKISEGIDGPVDFHAMTVSTANPDLVYGYYRKLQRSVDGGSTWELAKENVQPISLSSDPKRATVVYAATQNGVLVSEDKGDAWKSISSQLDGAAASFFAFDPKSEYALTYSVKLDGMGKSTDGGLTWNKVKETFGGNAVRFVAFSKTTSDVYAITEANTIYKSADKGETWSKVR